jgi:DNA-directed RNA polymerase specialized sigma24 family protein
MLTPRVPLKLKALVKFAFEGENVGPRMIKAIFRLSENEKRKILELRDMGVRPTDIARRFGLSEGVVHKIVQAQRALMQQSCEGPQLS